MNLTSKVKSNFHQMWRKEKSVIIFLMTGAAIITGLFVPKQHRTIIFKKTKKNKQKTYIGSCGKKKIHSVAM